MLTFVETRLFSRLLAQYLNDDEYALLQQALARSPERGSLPAHVLRKIREEIDG